MNILYIIYILTLLAKIKLISIFNYVLKSVQGHIFSKIFVSGEKYEFLAVKELTAGIFRVQNHIYIDSSATELQRELTHKVAFNSLMACSGLSRLKPDDW